MSREVEADFGWNAAPASFGRSDGSLAALTIVQFDSSSLGTTSLPSPSRGSRLAIEILATALAQQLSSVREGGEPADEALPQSEGLP